MAEEVDPDAVAEIEANAAEVAAGEEPHSTIDGMDSAMRHSVAVARRVNKRAARRMVAIWRIDCIHNGPRLGRKPPFVPDNYIPKYPPGKTTNATARRRASHQAERARLMGIHEPEE